jgi:hypothetical protein
VSSRKVVHPSMNDAIPRTIRSPLKRSTLSRAPVDLGQHCKHMMFWKSISSGDIIQIDTSQRHGSSKMGDGVNKRSQASIQPSTCPPLSLTGVRVCEVTHAT